MTALTPEILAEIEAAADAQYDQRPGPPVTAAQAAQIRPLLPPAQAEREAA